MRRRQGHFRNHAAHQRIMLWPVAGLLACWLDGKTIYAVKSPVQRSIKSQLANGSDDFLESMLRVVLCGTFTV